MNSAYSGIEVSKDYKKDVDFSKYKTFAWLSDSMMDASSLVPTNPKVASAIKSAVTSSLQKKGLVETTIDQADLIVIYTTGVQQKQRVIDEGYNVGAVYFGAGANVDRYGTVKKNPVGFGSNQAFDFYYKEGKIILDFYDRNTKKLVWRGTGVKAVDEKASEEKRKKNINEGIDKILKDFPPKSKK